VPQSQPEHGPLLARRERCRLTVQFNYLTLGTSRETSGESALKGELTAETMIHAQIRRRVLVRP